jgi:hypothetical protein
MNYLKENPNATEEDAIRWLNSKESAISDMPLSMTDFAKLSDASAVDRVSGRLFSD